mmetsp:Transcript_1418/g.1933  ORF Transcript_1418/g.1933 Transcript_1418/m.1933 type:complete len:389 (-) Transcript_1418:105-1271(-)
MVEGPGATKNGRKAEALVGATAKSLKVNKELKKTYEDQMVTEAFSVGKEVFLIFSGETALRFHFGMSGCLYVQREASLPPWRQKEGPTFMMELECPKRGLFVLQTTGSTTTEVSATIARSKLRRLSQLDVCNAETFDPTRVVTALLTRPTAMISDVILDQDKFPGVGNIIKIEGLHKARIHPKRLISSLLEVDLYNIVKECRAYAMGWCRLGHAPQKYVYNQTTCQTCSQSTVRMIKMGNDLSRVTFWCTECQLLDPNAIVRKRPRDESDENNKSAANEKQSPIFRRACTQHGNTIIFKRVRKMDSNNRQRIFRACRLQGCNFFAWADLHFPYCGCKKRAVLRVSKTENSGGKWFFSCPVEPKGTCGFFAWATDKELLPFQGALTPLL